MLAELALLAVTRAEPALAPLGLKGDAVRLWSRRRRCAAAWAEHEARCHALVRAAMADLPQKRKAVILGSGLLRDVPIEALSAAFEEVVLIDAVHLWPTRRRVRHLANLSFETSDLSGAGRWLGGKAPGREMPLADLADDPRIDLVISANLLSQLPMAPVAFAEQHPARAPLPPAALGRLLVQRHLADLAAFRARACLITDTVVVAYDPMGHEVARDDLLYGEPMPEPDEAWFWDVVPAHEARDGETHRHQVVGYRDLARALSGLR